jgi:hypothetical protein
VAIEDWRYFLNSAFWILAHPLFNVYYVFEIDPRKFLLPDKQSPAGIAVRRFRGEEIGTVAVKLIGAVFPWRRWRRG